MIVVVPARGGSKGLTRKNVLPLAGVPLIQHTLKTALSARHVTRVIVSTDDDEITAVVKRIDGVEVPFRRPAELASDTSSAVDVYLHAADWLEATEGRPVGALCALLPTSPLRLSADIDAAIECFIRNQAEVVLSVQQGKPLAWHQQMDPDSRLTALGNLSPQEAIANRQAHGPAPVVLNGSIYVLDLVALRRTRTYFGPKTYGYLMPPERSVDIDGPDDFRLAEALLSVRSDT
jgi:CMP-N,N'-diacetyllegionaminic acid synthase